MNISVHIQREIKLLLDKMGFHLVNTPTVQEIEGIFFVSVFVDDPKTLIGHQGKSLLDVQRIVRLLFATKYNQNIAITIDVNGYRRKRERALRETALSGRIQALRKKKVVELQSMNSYERRVIHATLASFSDISTASKGVGKARCVSIRPTKI